MVRILFVLLFLSHFSLICQAEIIEERGSLLEFFGGVEDGCEYDNWVSHISEGIALEGFNDYGPVELDRQTNGFGAYQIIDSLENPAGILEDWYGIFVNILANEIDQADAILSNSDFADYYQFVRLVDGNRTYLILREVLNEDYVDDNGTEDEADDVSGSFDYGWGLYVFNLNPTTPNVVLEVPHPCDDFITPFIAIDAFLLLNARAIFVSGAGREVEWTEEGEYNNAVTRSDPTRLQNVSAFQEAHKAIVDSTDSEFIVQFHSYDSAGRNLPQSILSAVSDYDPNPPLLDFETHFDIVSLTPLFPVLANSIGGVDHDSVRIDSYYSVYYDGGYFYDDNIGISNTFGGLQGWDSPQDRYSHANHDVLVDDENWLHIEHDEFPDVIREEILEFYPAEGVPTYQTYANAVEFYRPLYLALEDYYHKSRLHHVPQEYETIQSAIDGSFGGDTILVQPGTYTENIDFNGKNLLLTSLYFSTANRMFIDQTEINGDRAGAVITFNSGESANANLRGFTLKNGTAENGGGIYCVSSSPTIDHCMIIGNSVEGVGGAIFCENAQPIITNCTISRNVSDEGGGAIFGWSGSVINIRNCILWDNTPQEISFLRFGNQNQLSVSFSNIEGGIEGIVLRGNAVIIAGEGNIAQNPLFAHPQRDNYFLEFGSPCIDAGDPESPLESDSSRADIGTLPRQSQEIHINPEVLEFDEVYLERIDSLGLIISNTGQSPLTVYSQIIIPNNSPFSVGAGGGEIEIEAEADHVTWIRFLANQADDYMALLQIISNDPDRDTLFARMTATAVTVNSIDEGSLRHFGLKNIHPNPFNSTAIITYTLARAGNIRLLTYDINGRLIAVMKDGYSIAGRHKVGINAVESPSGVYIMKLVTKDNIAVKKFVIVK